MSARRVLRLPSGTLELVGGAPAIMGVVNLNAGSFSDREHLATPDRQLAHAVALAEAGAAVIDVGTDSGVTYRGPRPIDEQVADVRGVVGRMVDEGLTVSIDTYEPAIARAALELGAAIVNDVSGLPDPAMAELAAEFEAALVILHTRTAPKTVDYHGYDDVVADVEVFLRERIAVATANGVREDAILVDPGIGYAKLPEDDLAVVRAYDRIAALGHPILSGVSRKYFAALITGSSPDVCLPETLATLEAVRHQPGIVRVHDVDEVRRYIAVRAVIDGTHPYPPYSLDDETSKWVRTDVA
jgi:dihydropteroate synthase